MLFIIGNTNNFQASLETHTLHIRSKHQLPFPKGNLTRVQKEITCAGIKIHNSMPSNISDNKAERNLFKNEINGYILNKTFYSVKDISNSAVIIK